MCVSLQGGASDPAVPAAEAATGLGSWWALNKCRLNLREWLSGVDGIGIFFLLSSKDLFSPRDRNFGK